MDRQGGKFFSLINFIWTNKYVKVIEKVEEKIQKIFFDFLKIAEDLNLSVFLSRHEFAIKS
jgi:hypothetical protein